ncbi:mitochondrial thiamine pyrophosphate transporter [Dissophora globulifera]|nr:mitochondrial thiamine pyrophosphate transporter [Dissophora globulifera]
MAESAFAGMQTTTSSFVESISASSHSQTAVAPAVAPTISNNKEAIAAGSPKLTKIETVLCGSTAGVVSRFVIAPLDVVKIRLQLQTQRKELPVVLRHKTTRVGRTIEAAAQSTAARVTNAPPKYKGMLSGMATIAREEGVRGLWKGNMAAEYLYLTYGGIQFLAYQQTKAFLSSNANLSAQRISAKHLGRLPTHVLTTLSGSSSVQSFISGATAGIVATICTYPLDLLRTRFAVQRDVKIYTGVPQAFRHILRNEGFRGFYKGMTPALIQIIPYMGVMFGSYDTLKQAAAWLKARTETSESKTELTSTSNPSGFKSVGRLLWNLEDMLCGAISGMVSKTAVYPLDMVRKRLQIQGSEQQKANLGVFTSRLSPSSPSGATTTATAAAVATKKALDALPTSVWRCVVHIVRNEGYLALYKGLLPGVLKAAPASAVTFLAFSQMGALMERIRGPAQDRA